MLQFLRRKAQSLVIQAMVVIIALVFIFWGVGTRLMNKRETAIVVNGEEISFQQFQQAYDQTYARVAQQFGGTIPKSLVDSLNIKQQVINQLTQEALLRQGGQEMGLLVSSQEVQNEIQNLVQFQVDGKFNIERYNAILAANRLSPSKYENSLRYSLLANKTISSISAFGESTNEYEVEDLYNLEKETVSVAFTEISPDDFLDKVEVDENELEQWYGNNGDKYKTDKMMQLTYLPFSYQDTAKKVTIDEGAVETYYNDHLPEYQTPEKRHARHILLKVSPEDSDEVHEKQKQKAEEILKKARSGEDFATLAKEYSEGPTAKTGGDLGFFQQGQMVKPFSDAVFSMKKGEISDIVQTNFGYHIIKLEDIQLAGVKPLDEVRAQIANKLKLEQAKPLAFQVANSAYEGIIGAGSLAAYLEKNPDTEVVKTDFFSQAKPPAGMASDPKFLEKAFELKEGELSSLIEVADGYAIISATAIKEPQVPPLDEVREKVTEDFKVEKAREMAKEKAEQLLAKMNDGKASFEEIVQEEGGKLQQSGPLMKSDPEYSSKFPRQLVQDAFMLSASSPVPQEPGMVDNKYYVYRFLERKPPQTAMSDEDRTRYRELLQQFKQQELLDAWVKHQQAAAEIKVHQSLKNF